MSQHFYSCYNYSGQKDNIEQVPIQLQADEESQTSNSSRFLVLPVSLRALPFNFEGLP